jgi:hypothetical protein
MEQAYIEHTLKNGLNFRAGLQIVPIGLINEYHEPPVFYGMERNNVETKIIPSTWREIRFWAKWKHNGRYTVVFRYVYHTRR